MTTANTIIRASMSRIGALGEGETLSSDDAQNALEQLNDMLERWVLQRLMVYHIQQEQFTWPAGVTSRTIGSGGNFNTTRPMELEEGTFFRDENGQDFPLELIEDRVAYDSIGLKSTQSNYPDYLFYERVFPLGVLRLWPVPQLGITIFINSRKPFTQFTSLTNDIAFPPGYVSALKSSLAKRIHREFTGRQPPVDIVAEAKEDIAEIKRMNRRHYVSSIDWLQGGRYDIYTDSYG